MASDWAACPRPRSPKARDRGHPELGSDRLRDRGRPPRSAFEPEDLAHDTIDSGERAAVAEHLLG